MPAMRGALLLGLACAGAPAAAAPTRMMMPEGTEDIYVGVALLDLVHEGGHGRGTTMLPTLSVQWSNGAFLDMNSNDGLTVGWHLSDLPTWQYGPLLSLNASAQRGDAGDGRRGVDGEMGAFLSYQPLYNLDLSATVLAGGGADRRGVFGHAGATLSQPLASHHVLLLSAGLTVANQASLQSSFGVTPRQALAAELPAFRPHAGLLSTYLAAGWRWELSTKWVLGTGVRFGYLAGTVADSPLVGRRGRGYVHSALDYHY